MQNEKPLLVNASGDFSDVKIIQYKNKFLYSKYNPFRTIKTLIQNTVFLDNSLIVICSPCLWYGLKELMNKIPSSCKVIAIQDDNELHCIASEWLPIEYNSQITLCGTQNILELDDYIRQLVQTGRYKRAVRVDFCAGTQLNSHIYNAIFSGIQEIITSFWMNRITLVKMGRLFSKNIFQNLRIMENGVQLSDVRNTIAKPILVCGAGESLDKTPKNIFEQCFVIAADAALIALLRRHIHVDAVVSLESQYVIQKAYIGTQEFQDNIILFADIASRPSVVRSINNKTIWFASEYTKAIFLSNLQKSGIIKEFIPPLGSVGLAATLIATKLRKTSEVPIFITGLDFSYSIGQTHAKGTPAHSIGLSSSKKMIPIENYHASFAEGAFPVKNKSNHLMMSTKSMKAYADTFASTFYSVMNLFDLGKSGISLNIPFIDEITAEEIITEFPNAEDNNISSINYPSQIDKKEKIKQFYRQEQEALLTIKDLLIDGEESKKREKNISLEEQIKKLLEPREYLYLHFPDGYALSTELSFLKRIRAEIDFFLKQIKTGF
ncbi:MAG: DUF115 domain-containing protein [Treponema sp.]|nr:DUF115 domain-containing protein [Treponema sp.]